MNISPGGYPVRPAEKELLKLELKISNIEQIGESPLRIYTKGSQL